MAGDYLEDPLAEDPIRQQWNLITWLPNSMPSLPVYLLLYTDSILIFSHFLGFKVELFLCTRVRLQAICLKALSDELHFTGVQSHGSTLSRMYVFIKMLIDCYASFAVVLWRLGPWWEAWVVHSPAVGNPIYLPVADSDGIHWFSLFDCTCPGYFPMFWLGFIWLSTPGEMGSLALISVLYSIMLWTLSWDFAYFGILSPHPPRSLYHCFASFTFTYSFLCSWPTLPVSWCNLSAFVVAHLAVWERDWHYSAAALRWKSQTEIS